MTLGIRLVGMESQPHARALLAGVPVWAWPVAHLAAARGGTPSISGAPDDCLAFIAGAGWLTGDPGSDDEAVNVSRPFQSAGHASPALEQIATLDVSHAEALRLARGIVSGLVPEHALLRPVQSIRLCGTGPIEAVVSDVDGCLTDGGLGRTSSGDIVRTYHTRDGIAHHLLRDHGIQVAWLSTAKGDASIHDRAAMLGVDLLDVGSGDKGERLHALCERMGVSPERVLFLGDDTPDLPAIREAGLSAAPSDAHLEVRSSVSLVLRTPGGRGAFRELADLVLARRGVHAR